METIQDFLVHQLVLIGCIEAGLGHKDPNFWA